MLDLKAARLLPSGEVEDAEDLALLEARDLLFARLLQYRAFKQVAELFAELEAAALRRYPRSVALEDQFAELLPEVLLGVDIAAFAEIAAAVFAPRPIADSRARASAHAHHLGRRTGRAGAGHLQATRPGELDDLRRIGRSTAQSRWKSWRDFWRCSSCTAGKTIAFDQPEPLGPLLVSWPVSESRRRGRGVDFRGGLRMTGGRDRWDFDL